MKRFAAKIWLAMALSVASNIPAWAGAEETAPTTGFRAEFLADLEYVEKKLLRLADAIPQEKLSWRPAEGVRSVAELFLHIAGGHYGIPRMIGVKTPEGFDPKGFDKTTGEKAKIVEHIKGAFEHVRQAALKSSDADLDKTVKAWGQERTHRFFFLVLIRHMHEHLGQLSTYARMVGVVPPWVADELAKKKPH
jgi:uncharacterized damage-inducible protein DinB